jgi:hypothetical protein
MWIRDSYQRKKDKIVQMNEMLDSIPKDASVLADTYYVPYLAQRSEIYLLDGGSEGKYLNVDFVVMNTEAGGDWKPKKRAQLDKDGYVIYGGKEEWLLIFVSPQWLAANQPADL